MKVCESNHASSWTQKPEAASYVDVVKDAFAAVDAMCEVMQPCACALSHAAICDKMVRIDADLSLTDLFTTARAALLRP